MASETDICNLALSHIGDEASVTSIDPPEGSAQAERCAQFYPIARDTLLESHDWNFAIRRKQLAQLDVETWTWAFGYAKPSDALTLRAVLPPGASSDAETEQGGASVILTNTENAALRYLARVTDTNRFSSLFVFALSWHLASLLAGPVIKGARGTKRAEDCAKMARYYTGLAAGSDANQRRVQVEHTPDWMARR